MNAVPSRRIYGGASPEARVAERRARLLEAGLELLGTEGLRGTTVRGVIERARLTPRYFYESFRDLDSLITAVYDWVVTALREESMAALLAAGDRTSDRVRAVVRTVVDFYGDDPRKGRLVLAEAMASPALAERRLATSQMFAKMMTGEPILHSDPSREIMMAARFIVGGFSEILTGWLQGDLEVDRPELVRRCTELIMATLVSAATAEKA
ncbi:TetR/AcrR family transcriptional regulator [Actinocorallia sp. A-T 12471]|uniref:TetR/AcrR family transcriptional regulator n=1 Tax=Actinocorallia sp. A-T 12471 TaxID=3089813 RepID=UPI0029CC229D|nr:TetR family transcriptional regulator [Actinocorallia sp. A-T 12471]MDX6739672.1 TetR family transcriptional regulator [Actinocorallia sp. A-T 12471]